MSKTTQDLAKSFASTITKKIKWHENKSIASYEGFDTNTVTTTTNTIAKEVDKFLNPLLMLSPRCPRIHEHFCPAPQRWLHISARLSSASYSSPPTHTDVLSFDRVATEPDNPIGASAIERYYYLHEAFTIITFSIIVYIWFWAYGIERDNSSSNSGSSSASSSSSSSQNHGIEPYSDIQDYYQQPKSLIYDLELRLYNALPLRATSSLWGKINSYDLPIWMRSRLYDFFSRTYNCDMSEALDSDYRSYRNLSEFFSRRLKPSSRPISQEPGVVSPADGLVLHLGPIMDGRIEGVKGLNYSVQAFLGLPSNDYEKELLVNKEYNELYNCIIYLAPGDYHRFHSPANWLVNYRKHFPGRLLSVRPSILKRMPEILHINERVCYVGSWAHGFFSMTAVGATNVGSIKVNFDEDLKTNHLWRSNRRDCLEHKFDRSIKMEAGQDFGEFNFGSTIVLIFEAPKYSVFDTQDNQKIKYGQLMARIEPPAPKN